MIKKCEICNLKFSTKRDKKCCSRSCSNKLAHQKIDFNITLQTRLKQKIKRTEYWKDKKFGLNTRIYFCSCTICQKIFIYKKSNKKTCSFKCLKLHKQKLGIIAGKISASIQTRRSKNEISFANLCIDHFGNDDILTNQPIFNGWDADIIIQSQKIAILWNGKWHYEQCNKNHSVKQVQNRDKIKIKEIIKCGYKPYIIKDLGEKNIVEKEFKKLFINKGSVALVVEKS